MLPEGDWKASESEAIAARLVNRLPARSALAKTRTLMLYRMHRILSPEQNVKLDELFDKMERERRGKGRGNQ